ncbi:MAG: peptide-methionine (R)-S-oxide reductase MsrB [PS1 clade bacterium]|uniref:peptide-methionine (R)-S-oxide reductase n=1 Tax=PS1 clade bacterium TaxID=2175152 RepID=A0A937HGV7_9PROT|nr:peptide-methionine (R)-S-oxide reductase MsrB [PS1 clade bacterium]
MGRKKDDTVWPVQRTDAEWRQQLNDEQFYVTRQAGTERAFSGPYWDSKSEGTYHCVCCDAPLFKSGTKYDSGTGWPSFWEPVSEAAVADRPDNTLFMKRTETVCANCGAHLGHVFPDGPPPTGLRYCMNGTALTLKDDSGETVAE